jgi:UDP-N-acetyl-D-mannosaminuronate dehydrogenase
MPGHVASVVTNLLNSSGILPQDARVLLMGWSYKAEVGDPRETPAEPLASALMEKGISVSVWDPHLDEIIFEGVKVVESLVEASGYDLIILVTAHKACLDADWEHLRNQMRNPIIYDGRRVLDLDKMRDMGWKVSAVGMP